GVVAHQPAPHERAALAGDAVLHRDAVDFVADRVLPNGRAVERHEQVALVQRRETAGGVEDEAERRDVGWQGHGWRLGRRTALRAAEAGCRDPGAVAGRPAVVAAGS